MRAARVDDNQKSIVQGLRDIGCSVESLAKLGKGAPDIAVGWDGINFLFEIANPETRHGRAKRPDSNEKYKHNHSTTKEQRRWYSSWRGRVDIVETLEQAKKIVTGNGKPIRVVQF